MSSGMTESVNVRDPRTCNVVSVSSGKDSTAVLLLALDEDVPNRRYVFADTGNEHRHVYEYLDYLEDKLGITIDRVKATFEKELSAKREQVRTKWVDEGIVSSDEADEICNEVLQPSGNNFLDMSLVAGRFPSPLGRFCTHNLKIIPIVNYIKPLAAIAQYDDVVQWIGIRSAESISRRGRARWEADSRGLSVFYHPIIDWTGQQVVDFIKAKGLDVNPLYKAGFKRVGCMPCINSGKTDLAAIEKRFPEMLDRLERWERIVSRVSRIGFATYFSYVNNPLLGVRRKGNKKQYVYPRAKDVIASDGQEVIKLNLDDHGLKSWRNYARTDKGGKHFDLMQQSLGADKACVSYYTGVCE